MSDGELDLLLQQVVGLPTSEAQEQHSVTQHEDLATFAVPSAGVGTALRSHMAAASSSGLSHLPPAVAGDVTCSDIAAFARLSVLCLLQLNVKLVESGYSDTHTASGAQQQLDGNCTLANITAWICQAMQQATAAASDTQQHASRLTLQLLCQLLLLLSSPADAGLPNVVGTVPMQHGQHVVVGLLAKLIVACNSLQAITGAVAAAANSSTTHVLRTWLSSLEQQAACGGAADASVLHLCRQLSFRIV
jgi:hypothetical protein